MRFGSVNVPGIGGPELAAKQDKLTGAAGQVVGFDSAGAAAAVPGWSNPNILINWDFRHPVNRNGGAEYTAGGYTIDRWNITGGKGNTVTLAGSGIVFDNTAGTVSNQLYEVVKSKAIFEKEVSFSIIADGKLISARGCAFPETGAAVVYDDKKMALILRVMDSGYPAVCIWVYPGNKYTITAAKLELGSQQTLARQDADGNWVLNDPPNYDLQYALCSLYSPTTGEWVGGRHSNPNLLDNWYFVDPINQRGQAEYTGSYVYSIDHWVVHDAKYSVDSHEITAAGQSPKFFQKIESARIPAGTVCTFSVIAGGKLYSVSGDSSSYKEVSTPFGKIIMWAPSNGLKLFDIQFYGLAENEAVTITAAKLELGSQQTLAHQDASGNWVLNDLLNKARELLKCQRYYIKTRISRVPCMICTNDTSCFVWASVKLPTAMRLNRPTVVSLAIDNWISHSGKMYDATGTKVTKVEVMTDGSCDADGNIAFKIYLAEPLTDYVPASLGTIASISMTLSAEL